MKAKASQVVYPTVKADVRVDAQVAALAFVLDVQALAMVLAPMAVSKGAIQGAAIHALVHVAEVAPVANTLKVLNGVRKKSKYFFLTP